MSNHLYYGDILEVLRSGNCEASKRLRALREEGVQFQMTL